jgi:long-chain acyl-CoA synthetase
MNVYDYLLSAAEETPDKVGVEFQGNPLTYSQLADEARRIAAALREQGIKPGDSVGFVLPNLPQYVTSLYGSYMAGVNTVPMNVLLTPPEIRYLVEDSNLKMLFVFGMFLPNVLKAIEDMENPPKIVVLGGPHGDHIPFAAMVAHEDRAEPHPIKGDDTIMTIYTSGTTGKPKGAMITNANLFANLEMTDGVIELQEDDKMLCVLPLFHVFALNGLLHTAIRRRIPLVVHPKFEIADAVKSLAEDGITFFGGVPTMYFYILKQAEVQDLTFPKLRTCISGGAAMPVDVMRQFEEKFDVPIIEGFGLTETTVSVTMNRPDNRKPGSIGLPFEGVEIRVVDEQGADVPNGEIGEIIIKAPNVMKGYLNKPEATAEAIKDGWFYSGDLGYRDDEGFFYIVDRKKDMIIKGGYNIYPREIEEVLFQLPQVAEAAVVGIFDQAKGEAVRAVVSLKPGQTLEEEAIRSHIEANLAKYKWPQDYMIIPELPKGPTGKILKREIKKNWDQWNKDRVKPETQTAGTP